MRIKGLRKYRGRPSIEDLPEPSRSDAWQWFSRILLKRQSLGKPTDELWLRAILMGQAKRLALNPPTSAWGRSMAARKGGYATQQRYRVEGRTGPQHPAHKAAGVSACQRAWRKRERDDANRRERMGLPPKPRVAHLPLW